jgi:hypothetical protein
MKEKNMPLELKPGLRIGVGRGKLVLSHKEVKEDGLEIWAINYHLHIDGPIRDVFYSSAQILREIAKVEELERESKTRYEYGRRYFNRCNELDEQLTKSENLRDVANKTNKERIDKLESELSGVYTIANERFNILKDKVNQINELELDKLRLTDDANEYKSNFEKLDKIALMEMAKNEKSERLVDKLRFNNFMLWASTLCFFALWLIALYF